MNEGIVSARKFTPVLAIRSSIFSDAERRLEELQRQLDEHRRAGRRVERESDDDLVWSSWGGWQQ